MSLHPQPIPAIPEETARVAHTVLPQGNVYMQMRDELGTLFQDQDFLDLFPTRGQPAQEPWRLALVTVMQYAEGLTDRQAADAVRTRLDWKYALSLELTHPGFDFSVLSEFRSRLLANGAERRLFDLLLEHCRERGWLKAIGKQRTDSTHVLAAIRTLRRLECVGETMRHALNVLAEVAPDWLLEQMDPEWAERYRRRFSDFHLPKELNARVALAEVFGKDGRMLLDKVYASTSPAWLQDLDAIDILRRVWIQQYHASEHETPWRADQELPPSALLIVSPYDVEARHSRKKNTVWTGYKVHFTETCETNEPHLIVEVVTTAATTPDGEVIGELHEQLAEHELLPEQHLVDMGYVDGGTIRDRHGKSVIRVRFPQAGCQACPFHAQCTHSPARVLIFQPNEQAYRVLHEARARELTPEFRAVYAKRAGVEGTIAQAVRTCEMRRARYIGSTKLRLQAFFTATAMNVLRACEWMKEGIHASTPTSRFARLVASAEPAAAA